MGMTITANLTERAAPSLPPFAVAEAPERARPGQVWGVRECYDPVVIAGDSGQGRYRAYPLVEDVANLSNRDLFLAAEENPLGRPAMIAAWLVLHVERAMMLAPWPREIPAELVALADRVGRGRVVEHERIGTPLTGPEDPRYHYQARQMDVWRPVLSRAYAHLTEDVE